MLVACSFMHVASRNKSVREEPYDLLLIASTVNPSTCSSQSRVLRQLRVACTASLLPPQLPRRLRTPYNPRNQTILQCASRARHQHK